MNRFILFGGKDYYPQGGFNDFLADFEDLDTAKKMAEPAMVESFGSHSKEDLWAHVVDAETKKVVAAFRNQPIPHPIDGYTGEYEFVEYEVISCTD